jgi:hypothetical protein
MDTQIEASRSRTPVVRKAFAGLVLIVAAALILKLAIGFVIWLFWTIVTWSSPSSGRSRRSSGEAGPGVAAVVILFFFGLAGGVVGRLKGSSFFMWFLISACVPFVGLLAAVCYRWDNRELRRQCPDCGRIIKLQDAVCMRCGSELEFPDVAIASEQSIREARMAASRSG